MSRLRLLTLLVCCSLLCSVLLMESRATATGVTTPKRVAVAVEHGDGGKVIRPARAVPAWKVPVPQRRGRWLVDKTGRVLILHGENMISKYAPYTYRAVDFGRDDLNFLRREGINSIRLGFIWKALEPTPGKYDERYLNQVVATVRMAEAAGLLVVLDFHQDLLNEAFDGEGFPDWALDPAYTSLGFPAGVAMEWHTFMANRRAPDGVGVQDRLAAAWRHVTARLKHDRSVIFEPFNEPYPFAPTDVALGCLVPLVGCPVSDRQRLYPFYLKLLRAIRTVDRRRMVFFEPWYSFDYGIKSSLPRFADAQVGFAPHIYCPTGGAGMVPLPAPVSSIVKPCPAVFDLSAANMAAHEADTGEPTLVTEFGAGGPKIDHSHVEAIADRQMIGWHHWAYWSQDSGKAQTYGLLEDVHRGPVVGNVDMEQLEAITRPYPRVIAGTPLSWRFADGVFHFTYSTDRVGGGRFKAGDRTEVVLPSRHFSRGYRVAVRGGRVRSSPNAALLVVSGKKGADTIRVRVTPR